ncbi:MAG: hypothetical protein K0S41_2500 [Anaerocolumna sp.]|jgi:hypothetical protein|nr:hypothetical protein [Anaerocolumna sp.]
MKKTILYFCSVILVLLTFIFIIITSKENEVTPLTEKSTYQNVNDIEGVFLTTKENTYPNNMKEITVEFHNDTNIEYIYGEPFYLEKFENNDWYKVPETPSEYPKAWTSIGYILSPNSKREDIIKLEWIYGNHFDGGKYRIVKDVIYSKKPGGYDTYYLSAEFYIK